MIKSDVLLDVKEIVKAYGDFTAVNRISFNVKRGEIFGLLGPNGAGKTTTIRMLMGITAPDQGSLDFSFSKLGTLHKQVGYLPEDRGIYQTSKVLETITYFGELKGMSRLEVRKAGLEWLERFDLVNYANKKLEDLSKGMQQKVQFIISIIHNPEFAVLDEVFAGLDPVNQDLFKEIIHSLVDQGMTILLSSHRMNLVEELCDRIFLINRGQKVLYGSLAEIKEGFGEEKVSLRFTGDDSFFRNHPSVRELLQRADQVEFYLGSELSPNEFIRQIPDSVEVREISIAKPPLHDIFVRTIKDGEIA